MEATFQFLKTKIDKIGNQGRREAREAQNILGGKDKMGRGAYLNKDSVRCDTRDKSNTFDKCFSHQISRFKQTCFIYFLKQRLNYVMHTKIKTKNYYVY